MAEFKKGDRVQLLELGRVHTKNPLKHGTYLSSSRDGKCDRVQWDGNTKPTSIVKGYIEYVVEEGSDGQVERKTKSE